MSESFVVFKCSDLTQIHGQLIVKKKILNLHMQISEQILKEFFKQFSILLQPQKL